MGKSTHGPDWIDVSAMISALQTLHECSTSLELMPDTSNDRYHLQIIIISTWPSRVPLKRNPSLITKHGWLPSDGAEAAARVYGALHEHDAQISEKVYKQNKITEA